MFGFDTICNNLSPPLTNIICFDSLHIIVTLTILNASIRERFLHAYKKCFVIFFNQRGINIYKIRNRKIKTIYYQLKFEIKLLFSFIRAKINIVLRTKYLKINVKIDFFFFFFFFTIINNSNIDNFSSYPSLFKNLYFIPIQSLKRNFFKFMV